MEWPVLVIVVVLALVAAGVGAWVGSKPLRQIRRDPEMREQLKLPLRERWRYAKLARSEQVISDPEESRRALGAARVALTATNHAFSRRQILFLGLGLLLAGATRLRGEVDLRAVLFTFGFPVMFAVAYLMNRRQHAQMRRTAELNGWDLSEGSDPATAG